MNWEMGDNKIIRASVTMKDKAVYKCRTTSPSAYAYVKIVATSHLPPVPFKITAPSLFMIDKETTFSVLSAEHPLTHVK